MSESVAVNGGKKEQLKLIMRTNTKSTATTLEVNGFSDPILISHIAKVDPDIIVLCDEHVSHYSQNDTHLNEWSKHKVIIHSHNPM